MADESDPAIHGVLLAGGASQRMGRPKALLKVGGRSLLRWGIDTLISAGCASVTVVTGAYRGTLIRELPQGIHHIHARNWRGGMRASLTCGVRHAPNGPIVVHHVDAPGVRASTIRKLMGALENQPVVPVYHGQLGHPVVLPLRIRERLAQPDLRPLNALMQEIGIKRVEVDDNGVLSNVNTPAQFAKIQWLMREFRLDDLHRR